MCASPVELPLRLFACACAVVALMFVSVGAFADEPPSPLNPSANRKSSVMTAQAQKLHDEGMAHFDRGEYAKAFAAFTAAYNIEKNFAIASALGAAELKLRSFVECGVDLSHLVRRDGPEDQVMLVYVHGETGERVFARVQSRPRQPLKEEELDREYITAADYLHVDDLLDHEATLRAVKWMKEAGKTVTMDGSKTNGRVGERHRQVIPHIDVLITGEGFARGLTGIDDIWEAGSRVLAMGPHTFIETRGAAGCFAVTHQGQFHVPAFKMDVIDTTGAGDVFHGAYIVGMMQGWNPMECALFSSAVAAIKCTIMGGRAGIPTFEQTMAFLKEQGVRLPM